MPKRSSPIGGEIKLSRSFVRFSRNLDTNNSIGGRLGECLVNKIQVYRQKVTDLKSDEGSGAKDKKEQRRECTAEFPAHIVAAAALPRLMLVTNPHVTHKPLG